MVLLVADKEGLSIPSAMAETDACQDFNVEWVDDQRASPAIEPGCVGAGDTSRVLLLTYEIVSDRSAHVAKRELERLPRDAGDERSDEPAETGRYRPA